MGPHAMITPVSTSFTFYTDRALASENLRVATRTVQTGTPSFRRAQELAALESELEPHEIFRADDAGRIPFPVQTLEREVFLYSDEEAAFWNLCAYAVWSFDLGVKYPLVATRLNDGAVAKVSLNQYYNDTGVDKHIQNMVEWERGNDAIQQYRDDMADLFLNSPYQDVRSARLGTIMLHMETIRGQLWYAAGHARAKGEFDVYKRKQEWTPALLRRLSEVPWERRGGEIDNKPILLLVGSAVLDVATRSVAGRSATTG